ncbi:nucleotidyl transferase AbiEii/AbiGii toxin family protein [Helcococcus kunzii]|uniref:nucleotidyl transferase AbiEii/AbiGii toxin family protein n=1 Tax=Helcococcus kunzii TaxID=40091 RepID=UPI0038AE6517
MRSSKKIKGKVKHLAKEKDLKPQEVFQMYFFERILERLEKSSYQHLFIIKGGLLISSLIGINNRTTMDMDVTVKGIALTEENITRIVKEILSIDVKDGIKFIFEGIKEIRESDKYENYRISFSVRYGRINNPMKMDITTGDIITPREVIYKYPMIFDDGHIEVMSYPLETILAEKIETIIRRNITSTRMRDFYDVYILYKIYVDRINFNTLMKAIENTSNKRGSIKIIENYKEILKDIKTDNYIKQNWKNYLKANSYVKNIELTDTLDVLKDIFDKIKKESS